MNAKEGVVNFLNGILSAELTAINQYFLHAKLCEHWGYERLSHSVRGRSLDEMKAADRLIGHILYLEDIPKVHATTPVRVGETVPEQLKLDLTVQRDLLALLSDGVRHCTKVADFTTRHLLEDMAKEVDAQIEWIETQLDRIAQAGLKPYLAEQIREAG
ncbi:MAG TPA: bacterioferritin [Nitrospiraceae bacterium]|nr:bacterioferritin [Nitrospiraceae bacterium]